MILCGWNFSTMRWTVSSMAGCGMRLRWVTGGTYTEVMLSPEFDYTGIVYHPYLWLARDPKVRPAWGMAYHHNGIEAVKIFPTQGEMPNT
jgi:hypothetical protein